jgi:hypothetical protein
MSEVTCIRLHWSPPGAAAPWVLPFVRYRDQNLRFFDIHIQPEPGYPAGRKGLMLSGAWQQMGREADGMLILDGDVAIDPQICQAMMSAISTDDEAVWTAPVKIWPAGTMREDWVWAHWEKAPSQVIDQAANWFSFNFTYLPRRLLDSCDKSLTGLKSWTYPVVDASVSKHARKLGIPGRVVPDCFPVHMHW